MLTLSTMSERKTEILEVTRKLFLEGGLANVSMRKVAAEVGVSATAIYRHYRDKDDLVAEVVIEGHRLLMSRLARALRRPSPRERMLDAGAEYLGFALAQEEYYRVMFMSWDTLDAQAHAKEQHGESPTFQFLLTRVEEGQAAGVIERGRDPMQVAVFLWSVCHGLAALYLAGGMRQLGEDAFCGFARASLAQAIDGLAALARKRNRGSGLVRRRAKEKPS